MKKNSLIIFLIIFCIRLFSQYSVSVSIKGFQTKKIYLASYYGLNSYKLDSAEWNADGSAVIKSPDHSLLPGMYSLVLSPKLSIDLLIDKERDIKITSDTSDIIGHFTVSGSEELQDYTAFFKKHMSVVKEQAKNSKMLKTCSLDSAEYLHKKNKELGKQIQEMGARIIKAHPASLLALYITLLQKPSSFDVYSTDTSLLKNFSAKYRQYLDAYFSEIDFSNESLVRLPVFEEKISFFYNYLLPQRTDTLKRYIDLLLVKCEPAKEVYKFVLRWLFQNYYNRFESKEYEPCFVYLVDKYYMKGKAFWAKDAFLKLLSERMELMRPTLYGAKVPDLNLLTPDDKKISLYQIQSPYTILYFYEYDCGFCRLETPKLLDIYNKYKGKAEVVAVYMLADKTKWQEYIDLNKLKWINAHDPLKESKIRDLYFIQKVPTIYLLDKDKNVIEKRVTADELKDILKKLLP